MVDFKQMVYVQEKAQYEPRDEVAEGQTILDISGTELRRRLQEGLEIPDWFSLPGGGRGAAEVEAAARGAGLHGVLHRPLGLGQVDDRQRADDQADGDGRPPGDAARRRRGAQAPVVASSASPRSTATSTSAASATSPRRSPRTAASRICAPIAPYAATRAAVREMVESYGAFLEVHVATSLEECERRDRKGLYKLAREGKIKEFTGISDPYEAPKNPELRLETEGNDDRLLRPAGDPEAREHGPDPGLRGVALSRCAQGAAGQRIHPTAVFVRGRGGFRPTLTPPPDRRERWLSVPEARMLDILRGRRNVAAVPP